jgi:hypothetical protein
MAVHPVLDSWPASGLLDDPRREVSLAEERLWQILRAQGFAGAAVRDHGPLPRSVHEHEDLAGAKRRISGQMWRHVGP